MSKVTCTIHCYSDASAIGEVTMESAEYANYCRSTGDEGVVELREVHLMGETVMSEVMSGDTSVYLMET